MAVVVLAATVPGIAAEAGVARRHAAMLEGISHAERRQYFYASLLSSLAAAKEIRLFGLGDLLRGNFNVFGSNNNGSTSSSAVKSALKKTKAHPKDPNAWNALAIPRDGGHCPPGLPH